MAQAEDVAFVQGLVPVFRKYIALHKSRAAPRAFAALDVLGALARLKDFLYHLGQPMRTRQKLLRNLGVIEMFIEMLQWAKSGSDTAAPLVCTKLYDVMASFMDGDSRKNELFMARHIGFFQQQV